MEIEYLEVEKDANQLHLCHRGVMISPWNGGEFVARQTNTDNDVGGESTEVFKTDSPSFIFLVAILAFMGQLASIFIGMLYVSWKNDMLKLQYPGPQLLEPAPRYKLEDDPQCGLTTGGQEDCFWDCNIVPQSEPFPQISIFDADAESFNFTNAITNPECLLDCFHEVSSVSNFLMTY